MDDGGSAGGGPLDEGAGEDDPFEGLTLDDDFVAGAAVREESADARLARLARIEAEHRRLAAEREVQRASLERNLRRQARRQRVGGGQRQRLLVIALMLVAAGGLVAWNVRHGSDPVSAGPFGDGVAGSVSAGARPPAGVGAAAEPLGTPPPLARESSAYAFMAKQEGSDEPVAYDPCRAIHVVVNPRTAVTGADAMVQQALAAASTATGLQFVVEGVTDEAPSPDRAPYQPERYGERWAPVLISWTDPAETPELAGDVAGLGGSGWVSDRSGSVYVSGSIELDGPQLQQVVLGPDGVAGARSVIEHELAHLLGLDHVEDPSQLMNPTGGTVTGYADGDLTGLNRLGEGACFPKV